MHRLEEWGRELPELGRPLLDLMVERALRVGELEVPSGRWPPVCLNKAIMKLFRPLILEHQLRSDDCLSVWDRSAGTTWSGRLEGAGDVMVIHKDGSKRPGKGRTIVRKDVRWRGRRSGSEQWQSGTPETKCGGVAPSAASDNVERDFRRKGGGSVATSDRAGVWPTATSSVRPAALRLDG